MARCLDWKSVPPMLPTSGRMTTSAWPSSYCATVVLMMVNVCNSTSIMLDTFAFFGLDEMSTAITRSAPISREGVEHDRRAVADVHHHERSEEHTSELQ